MPDRRDTIAVATTQPVLWGDPTENLALAVELVREAAASGAELIFLPEVFPGPRRVEEHEDHTPALAAVAAECGCAIAWGRIEERGGRWRVVHRVEGSSGELLARYERTHPATGDVNEAITGGAWISPGEELCVFEVLGVHFGLLVCPELWQPEVARTPALRGAEVILAPAGGGLTALAPNWELVAKASTAALVCAELDLGRARWPSHHDDSMAEPKPFRSLSGLPHARQPALYPELVTWQPDPYDYDDLASIRPVRGEGHEVGCG